MTTHQPDHALSYATRAVLMRNGAIRSSRVASYVPTPQTGEERLFIGVAVCAGAGRGRSVRPR